MSTESWLPIGYVLPDGANCRQVRLGETDWQIIDTAGGGQALLVTRGLHDRWQEASLIDSTSFRLFSFGTQELFEISCRPSERIFPVSQSRSPNSRGEALAFAVALKETRNIDPDSPLQDAIYVESLGRLLPTFSLSARVSDDVILGFWLTGGAPVSAKSRRRLQQMIGWLGSKGLHDVVAAAGMDQLSKHAPAGEISEEKEDEAVAAMTLAAGGEEDGGCGLDHGRRFALPGRPLLEDFFNEHVVDIVRHKERYAALGVGFPSPVVLHGPPGCGKTFAVEELIGFLGWPSFQIDASSVASPYIHDTSKKVAEVFNKAMQSAPSVLVIDEMEAFLADRESGSGSSSHRVEEVAEFLRRIPEAAKNDVLIVAMTNRLEMIDPAIMRRGRFDHVIQVDPATEVEVKALLGKLLARIPTDVDVDMVPLAKGLAGRPLSDVAFVVREGARLSAREGHNRITQNFLIQALESTPARGVQDTPRSIGFV